MPPLTTIASTELLMVVVVGLLLFGRKLPDVAKAIGRSFFEFRRGVTDLRRETGIDDALRDMKREANSWRPPATPPPSERRRPPALEKEPTEDAQVDEPSDAPPDLGGP